MAQAKKIVGKDFFIFIGGKAIAATTSTDIEYNTKTADSSTKDDGIWEAEEVVGLSWSLSNDSFYTVGASGSPGALTDALEAAWMAAEPVDVKFGRAANASNGEVPTSGWTVPAAKTGYEGKAVITSLRVTATNGDKAKVSVSLKGVGVLKATAT